MTTPRLDLECEIVNRLSQLHCSEPICRKVIDRMIDDGMVLVVGFGRVFIGPSNKGLKELFDQYS